MSQWNDEYYEIIDFYFWEPQHIGRSKTEKSRYKNMEDVKNHILNMEVSLNHQLNIFFRLAPEDFINKLVKNYFHNSFDDKYLFHGSLILEFKNINKEQTICFLIVLKSKNAQESYC